MAAGSVPRCRFRASRPAVKAASSPSVRDITAEVGTTRKDGAAYPGCRRHQPRRDRHRSQSEDRLYQRRVYRTCSATRSRKRMGRQANELLVGRHTDRRTLEKLRRWIDRRKPAARRNSSPTTKTATRSGSRPSQGVPQRPRADQVYVRAADRYHRDQAVAVAAAVDHERAGRRNPDYGYRRPALQACRGDRA